MSFVTLRLNARGICAAGALALSAFAVAAAAGPAYGATTAAEAFHFVMISGGHESTINGSSDDYQRAKALRSGTSPLLYVRERGAGYVIRDAALLRRADQFLEPQRKLGEQQGALGRQQGELGRRQGELGHQQGQLGHQTAQLVRAGATTAQLTELAGRQAALGKSQAALGEQQAALGRRQNALGEEQRRLSDVAQANLRKIFAEAKQRGLAQRVD